MPVDDLLGWCSISVSTYFQCAFLYAKAENLSTTFPSLFLSWSSKCDLGLAFRGTCMKFWRREVRCRLFWLLQANAISYPILWWLPDYGVAASKFCRQMPDYRAAIFFIAFFCSVVPSHFQKVNLEFSNDSDSHLKSHKNFFSA